MSRAHPPLLVLGVFVFALAPAEGQSPARTDPAGDPLPPGALVRMGTLRWRAGEINSSALSPDGRSLFVSTGDRIRVFDLESGRLLRSLRGRDEDRIGALTVSPDGKLLASAGYQSAFLWDVESGKQLRPLKVRSVAVMTFSADGKKLITGGEEHERSVRVLDLASGKEELRLLWHQRQVSLVACSPDGKTLITASDPENHLRITDLGTGEPIHTFHDKDASDSVIAVSADARTIAVAQTRYRRREPRWSQTLRLIDATTGKERQFQADSADKAPPERTRALLFSPDGKSLVTSGSKEFRVWDVASGKQTRAFPGAGARLHFTPDGRHLIAASSVLRVWDMASGKELHPPEGPVEWVESLAFAPDGKTLAGSSGFGDRGTISLWDAGTGKLKASLRGHESYIRAVQFAPDGRLVSGGGDSTLRVWDVAAGKEVFHFKLHEPRASEKPLQVVTMQVSRDGRTLSAAGVGFEGPGSNEKIHLFAWNLANRKLLALRESPATSDEWPGLSPDGKTVLERVGKELSLKDLLTGKESLKLQPVPQPGGPGVLDANVFAYPFLFSPDGRVVALHSSRARNEGPRYWHDRYALVLFDLSTGKEVHRIPVGAWCTPDFSPDGKRLAAADGPVVRIWDTGTGKRLWESPPLETTVRALAFSPDGQRLATALDNITTLVWDVRSTKSEGRTKP